ncbi:MAG TPA: hypothetical protein VLC09_14960 [Polyangiaceae bacterium]|nr:hypothetical protein [Polyangiaceae bacterium]
MSKLRLPLIGSGEELSGAAPPAFERSLRAATPGDAEHRRLVGILIAPTREAASSSVPPSAARFLTEALDAAQVWAGGGASTDAVHLGRKNAFAALPTIEDATIQAVRKAQELEQRTASPLDRHADHVVLRYASLAAHFATSATCHLLDAIETPPLLLEVLRDVAGAHAYLKTGLGAARDPAFRARSVEQAEWEAARPISRALGHAATELAPQIFHEFLGARWRALATEERGRLDALVTPT